MKRPRAATCASRFLPCDNTSATISRSSVTTLALVQAHCTVDLWQFEQLARAGIASCDQTQLQAAVALYRGDFLAGFVVRNAADFDRWVYNTQERLRGLAVHVLTTLAYQYVSAGELEPQLRRSGRFWNWNPGARNRIAT